MEMGASREWYELRDAVLQKDFSAADRLLEAHPALSVARNGIGETVLHFLAVENDEAGVAWLKSRGFALDTKNEFGTPAVFEVAQLRHKALLNWFIESGADISGKDGEGRDIRTYLTEFDCSDMISVLNAPRA